MIVLSAAHHYSSNPLLSRKPVLALTCSDCDCVAAIGIDTTVNMSFMSFLSSCFLFSLVSISICAMLGWWSRRTGFAYTSPSAYGESSMHVQYSSSSSAGVAPSRGGNSISSSEMSNLGSV